MKKRLTAAVLAAVAAAIAVPALAHWPAGIEQRERSQQGRIGQGIRSGEITPREAARLEREQWRTERMERRFRADGRFTCGERARIHRRLDRSSHHIWRARHNRRGAW